MKRGRFGSYESYLPLKFFPFHVTMKVPPPNRRHEFRYAKCARQTFMCGGASAAGRMKVYYESLNSYCRSVYLLRWPYGAKCLFLAFGVHPPEGTKVGLRVYRGAEVRFDECDNDYLVYAFCVFLRWKSLW